jgi:hypothetical protein
MTTASNNSETIATHSVIGKANEMSINGIAETGKSNSNTYAIRDYSRKVTKDNTPVRYITRVSTPENVTAWLIENMSNGSMVRTLNGVTHYEIGHALAVWNNTIDRAEFPLMPRRGSRRRGANGVSVERALSIYDND